MKWKYKAETLEKAIDIACDEINVDPEYLHYHIIKQEENEVDIEAYTMMEVIDFCQDYLLQIIKDYELEGKATTQLNEGVIKITLDTTHNSIIIGKNGKTLQSMNEMVRNACFSYFQERFKILVDINDYKDEKYEKIIRIAKRVAREVQKTKVNAQLDPMTSDERRVIHNALSRYDNIKTESSGHGNKRAVNIIYVENSEIEANPEE